MYRNDDEFVRGQKIKRQTQMKLRTGQHVTLTYRGREKDAVVRIVSQNQKSIAFTFDGMLGGYIGMMPALDHGDGYRDLVEGEPVEVRE